ncbi:uncharacterized protein CHSO_4346 [Chryseobacterium sp. StRB126]|uniref:DUF2004 domain-containing protein n=1 Tax=Chryseobacterium sp. StRB126 TaxID=878220 RepID=UPI0004E990B6|nr:DUF2004 domain-containing protein [Chryseobacterium sp. StRB126]BAP33383.1 uncharacterized protein CHSO_4346 [Chryseobacterium sp. StRB126]
MAEYTLPYFGQLSTDNIEEYYDATINLNGNEVQIDLNFESENTDGAKLDQIKNYLENIEPINKLAQNYILEDYHNEDGDTVKLYLEHHLEEVEQDKLSTLINFDDSTVEPEQQLLTKLELVRIGLYPDNEDGFAILDYSIGKEITDYLVVINTDQNGQLDYMSMES